MAATDGQEGDARRRWAELRANQNGACGERRVNQPLPPRDRGNQSGNPGGQSRFAGALSGAFGLVGGVEASAAGVWTRKNRRSQAAAAGGNRCGWTSALKRIGAFAL